MKESAIQRDIVRFLRSLHFAVWETSQGYRKDPGGTRMTAGLPDLVVIRDDAWTFAEVKNAKGKLSTAQEGFRTAALDAGIPWQLWRDVTDAWDWCVEQGVVNEWTPTDTSGAIYL